ncbi:MAG: hypothetical protein Q4D56_00230 [Bacteroides sp.]|nr:hypothetical protein [Bacteroides sp.]
MNSMKKMMISTLCAAIAWVFMAAACSKYEVAEDTVVSTETYNGSVFDYLKEDFSSAGITFDSLLYLIGQNAYLEKLLSSDSVNVTLFAVPDACFDLAFTALNAYRHSNNLGDDLVLDDFLIDAFTLVDTVINDAGTSYADTMYVSTTYDYRAQLDSLLSRYVFAEAVTTDYIMEEDGAVELGEYAYGHTMRMEADRGYASGASELGSKWLNLIEMNGTKSQSEWITCRTMTTDVETTNGVVHIVSPQHEFGFNEMTINFKDYGNEE